MLLRKHLVYCCCTAHPSALQRWSAVSVTAPPEAGETAEAEAAAVVAARFSLVVSAAVAGGLAVIACAVV
jgi:hypothetical protein